MEEDEQNMEEQNVIPAKQRITFYAPKTVQEIIEQVKIERGDDSITDAVCQIIIEYGSNKHIRHIENLVDGRFSNTIDEINELRIQNELLSERLSLVESKCATVNRAVSEMQTQYKKE